MGDSSKYFVPPSNKRGTGRGLFGRIPKWVLILGFVVLIIVVPFFFCGYLPSLVTTYFMEDNHPVPGDAANFDLIANYAEIEAYAGDGRPISLISLSARYVRSDGTMDLNADYFPSIDIEYVQQMEAPPPDAPPIGAGGAPDGIYFQPISLRIFQPGQMRSVTSTSSSYSYIHQGIERDKRSATTTRPRHDLPDPACSFADMWDVARTRDAPDGAVAVIEYDEDGYEFRISDLNIDLEFDMNCNLIPE